MSVVTPITEQPNASHENNFVGHASVHGFKRMSNGPAACVGFPQG